MTIHPNIKAALIPAAFFAAFLWAQADDHGHEFAQAQELEAAQQDAEALASREWTGQQVCGPAAHAQWLDDKTLQCTPKRGPSYAVAQ